MAPYFARFARSGPLAARRPVLLGGSYDVRPETANPHLEIVHRSIERPITPILMTRCLKT